MINFTPSLFEESSHLNFAGQNCTRLRFNNIMDACVIGVADLGVYSEPPKVGGSLRVPTVGDGWFIKVLISLADMLTYG